MNVRWGIIGTGGIARAFAKDLALAEGHSVVAVGSRTPEVAANFAKEFGVEAFGSYEELVKADLDAIYVATPHPMHSPNTILALNAGKPVLCEKPFAVNASQSAAMIATARSNNLLLVEAMWSRFLPHYARIRTLIADDAIGEIRLIEADHGQPLPADPYYRLHAPELAGGALLDLGIYPISFTYMLLGKPQSIEVAATKTSSGVDAQTSMIFGYNSGAHALLTTTLEVRTPCTARVVGTKGVIEIDSPFYNPTSMRLIRSGCEPEMFPKNYSGHGLREQAIEFERLLKSGAKESDLMPLNESQSIMETMDYIRERIDLRYPFED